MYRIAAGKLLGIGVCDDAGMMRRVRPMGIAFAVYDVWRRLPPEQRERVLIAARRNAPRVAWTIARRGRPRR